MQHVDDLNDAGRVRDVVFVGRSTVDLWFVVLGQHVEPMRGELPVSRADERRVLRDDDDELRSDDDNHNAPSPRLLGRLRVLVDSRNE